MTSVAHWRRYAVSRPGLQWPTALQPVPMCPQNVFFSEEDFQVGSVLVIYSRAWELLDGDAFTLRYMENEPARFPQASYDRVGGE